MLDHSVILYGSGMGNANVHSHVALPYLVAGTGAGTIQGGRHIKARTHDPSGNLLLSVVDKFGIAGDRVGLSTGRVDSSETTARSTTHDRRDDQSQAVSVAACLRCSLSVGIASGSDVRVAQAVRDGDRAAVRVAARADEPT